EISSFLSSLAGAKGNREELKSLLALMRGKTDAQVAASLKSHTDDFGRLPEASKQLATEAAKDLDQLLSDIPDATLNSDWAYLVREIRSDLLIPPAQALAELNAVRQSILKTGAARVFMIGSSASRSALQPDVAAIIAGLENAPFKPASYTNTRLVEARVRARLNEKDTPVFVG